MDLVEQGKLSLDASVRQYLPELPAFYQSVTLRELLSHQSGVRDDVDEENSRFSSVHYPTSRDALKVMMTYPLAFMPGEKVGYSSRAFTVLGAAAESVSGRSFQQLSIDFFPSMVSADSLSTIPTRLCVAVCMDIWWTGP